MPKTPPPPQNEAPFGASFCGGNRKAEVEVAEMLAGSRSWRQSSGLPEALSGVPAFRAAGASPAG
jgi:hypothetical protein